MKRTLLAVALLMLVCGWVSLWAAATEPRDVASGALAGGEAARAGAWVVFDWANAGQWAYTEPDGTVVRCPLVLEDTFVEPEPMMLLGDGRFVHRVVSFAGYGHARLAARPLAQPWDWVEIALPSCCVFTQAGVAAAIVDPYWLSRANGTVVAAGTGALASDSPLREWTVGTPVEVNLVPNFAGSDFAGLVAGREAPLAGAVGLRRIAPEAIQD